MYRRYNTRRFLERCLFHANVLYSTLRDTFLGYRLIDLPESNISVLWVPLSKQEMILAR